MVDELGLPLVVPLDPVPQPDQAWWAISQLPACLFLDSAQRSPQLGRYSFLMADPIAWLTAPADGTDGLESVQRLWQQVQTWQHLLPPEVSSRTSLSGACYPRRVPDLPPFQGGFAGLFSYDLARSLERLPRPRFDEFDMPALAIGLYDVVLAWDHHANRAWLISQGWPETDPQARRERARDRLHAFQSHLSSPSERFAPSTWLPPADVISPAQLAPRFPMSGADGLESNFSPEGYLQTIRRAIEYIRAGDIFQVNLAQRLLLPQRADSRELYLRLRRCNPAPFAGYFNCGAFQVLSASPERFLSVSDRLVEARPIKGTRRRLVSPEADLLAAEDLLHSEKDRAENIMIVDLLRNDLARVCRPESLQVTQLCGLETFQFVQHLVSVVRGQLASGKTSLDLVRGAFPGGSITGAPKIRAMEIIAELEPTARGAYCGSLGYLGWDGTLDLSILIRTIVAGRGWWQFAVGGGITLQSDPRAEYEETWHKAQGLIQSVRE